MKTDRNFKENRQINYLSKDFSSFKENLLEFAKTYYKDTYNDFSEASTGMMFIDLASYVGDVLSYYTDYQFNESFLVNSTERENLLISSRFLGYRPKLTRPSTVTLDLFHVIPSIRDADGNFVPDYRQALKIDSGLIASTQSGIKFSTTEAVDFSTSSSLNPTEISVFSRADSGEIDAFLLKKQTNAISAEVIVENYTVTSAQQFLQIPLNRSDAIDILSVVDSDGNSWYEVEYLSQDVVYTETQNVELLDSRFSRFSDSVPMILGSLKTSRKFTTFINSNNKLVLEFGSGDNVSFADKEIVDIKSSILAPSTPKQQINPSAFLNGRSYGLIPKNTTLTITYLAGGGISSNVSSSEIVNIDSVTFAKSLTGLSNAEIQLQRSVRGSLRVINTFPAVGGAGIETDVEIRNNALLHFNSQNRTVSREDYLVRILSMPSKFGSVAKAYVTSEDDIDSMSKNPFVSTDKSFGVNIYLLSFNSNKNLVSPNEALVHNLSKYLNKSRMLTDDITIFSGNVINIGLNFEVIAFKGENKQRVLFNCIETAKEFFNIDNMNFNQPINLNTLSLSIANVSGVQSVSKLEIKNLTLVDGDYSPNSYNISSATYNGLVFPSLDPSIFEVKFPNRDIIGKVL